MQSLRRTAVTQKLRIVMFLFGVVLARVNPQTFSALRTHVSTGYSRVEGNRRASRNGLVSDLPAEIPQLVFIL